MNTDPTRKEDDRNKTFNIKVLKETMVLKKITVAKSIKRQKTPSQHIIPIRQKKIRALKYTLNENGDAIGEEEVELNIITDKEYVNIELDNYTVYSLKTTEIITLFF
jgi:hypothetical protein